MELKIQLGKIFKYCKKKIVINKAPSIFKFGNILF